MTEDKVMNTPETQGAASDETKNAQNEADGCASAAEKSKKDTKSELKKLKAEQAELNKKLEEEKKRAEEINDKYLRVVAEYDNFRKRSSGERAQIYSDAVADTLSGLLPIIDNLQYAAKYSSGDAEKVAEGLNLILGKLPETLEKLGISVFGVPGETFDPNLHNAILHVDDETLGEGEITDVLQCGYKYKDKVIRYAMVKVAN
ncbi:MAG: nucleotide exchange factor GrpE [Clostridia bacterium]|nr:nucleotide exchange factor GrpE [Clostridia bacterium]